MPTGLGAASQGAFFDHIADQFTLPVGVRAEIDADAGTIRLPEPAWPEPGEQRLNARALQPAA